VRGRHEGGTTSGRPTTYSYRNLTPEEQADLVAERRRRGFPWHRPPHPEAPDGYRIVTAACFEHRNILNSAERLGWFEDQLLSTVNDVGFPCAAWCVLPNHYHLLVQVPEMKTLSKALGRLHGRTAFEMNREDDERGRQVWYHCQDRVMRSDRHYWTSLNYIHNNPVKHGYVEKWQLWPFSSVHWYLAVKGREWLVDVWREYPVRRYGDGWDD
jgi:putative transposase